MPTLDFEKAAGGFLREQLRSPNYGTGNSTVRDLKNGLRPAPARDFYVRSLAPPQGCRSHSEIENRLSVSGNVTARIREDHGILLSVSGNVTERIRDDNGILLSVSGNVTGRIRSRDCAVCV